MNRGPDDTLSMLRRALVATLVLGNVGVGIELLLLRHTDGFWQLIPLSLIGTTLLTLAWYGLARSARALKTVRAVLVLCLVSGGVGMVQHFRGNIVYAAESNPSLTGRELYLEAISGSTPTLAPGAMMQLALVGLLFAFRHPVLRGAVREADTSFPRTAP